MSYLILTIILSYLIGSIPTSIIAGKLLRGIDIREHGSGNAGATNVFRVLGWKAGVVVLLVDVLKGVVSTVWVSRLALVGFDWQPVNVRIVAGLCAVIGHIWTIFAGFRGGKGIATGLGMVIGITPVGVLICVIVFIGVVAITRYVSLGSILAALALPMVLGVQKYSLGDPIPVQTLSISMFIPLLVLYTHRQNLRRLFRGEENKLRLKKTGS